MGSIDAKKKGSIDGKKDRQHRPSRGSYVTEGSRRYARIELAI